MVVERALSIALRAHAGKVDKAGEPIILHAIRVGMAGTHGHTHEQIVGFLHDTVEDGITEGELRELFAGSIVDAVMALTRRTGEPYMDYIERVAVNPLARAVKLNDLRDHIQPERIDNIPMSLMLRYEKAIERLEREWAIDRLEGE